MKDESGMVTVVRMTPAGRGAVATLRMDGVGTWNKLMPLIRTRSGRTLDDAPIDRPTLARIGGDDDGDGEEVVLRRFADGVEIHCHGGQAAVARILTTLETIGVKAIEPPEWLDEHAGDPIKAEAWAALMQARTERTAAILLDQYCGALRRTFDEIESLQKSGDAVRAREIAEEALKFAEVGRHLVRPWRVMLAGEPNVGKSSLMNALAGFSRSIVHNAPGTTRDAVTFSIALEGWPIELCDTAGLRETTNEIEREGVELARRRLDEADLILLVADCAKEQAAEETALLERYPQAVVVLNKCDLPVCEATAKTFTDAIRVSAVTGEGVDSLRKMIVARLIPSPPPPGAAVPFTDKQIEALRDRA